MLCEEVTLERGPGTADFLVGGADVVDCARGFCGTSGSSITGGRGVVPVAGVESRVGDGNFLNREIIADQLRQRKPSGMSEGSDLEQ